MACSLNTLNGLGAACENNMGGIIEVYINHYDKISAITETDNEITEIALVQTSGETPTAVEKFHRYSFKRNTGSLSSNYTIDNANGVNFVQSDLSLVFGKQDTAKRIEINALALDDLCAIVKDANGYYWYLGQSEPLQAISAAAETGVNRSDGNKYSITLQDTSLKLPAKLKIKVGTGTGVDLSEIVE